MRNLSRLYEEAIDVLLRQPWEDYFLLAGMSDRWITCMVVSLTQTVDNQEIQLKRFVVFSELERKSSLTAPLGFNKYTPCDCDSTAWLAHCCLSMNVNPDKKILDYINSHGTASYSYCTYNENDNVHDFIGYPLPRMTGWLEAHDCVTANVTGLFPIQFDTDFFHKSFNPYWWASKLVPLAFSDDWIAKHILTTQDLPMVCSLANVELEKADNLDRLLKHIFEIRFNSEKPQIDFPLSLALNDLGCLLQLPPPEISPSMLESYNDWNYNGFKQGARVYDTNSVLTAAIIVKQLSLLIR